jgi:autotransporter-associated beta strand protein
MPTRLSLLSSLLHQQNKAHSRIAGKGLRYCSRVKFDDAIRNLLQELIVKLSTRSVVPSLCGMCWLVALAVNTIVIGPAALLAQVTSTSWTDTSSIGNWFTSTNWTNGVLPSSSVDATVDIGTPAQISAPPPGLTQATTPKLSIGTTVPGSTVQLLFNDFLVVNQVIIGPGGTFINNGGIIPSLTTSAASWQNNGQMIFNTQTNYLWQSDPIFGSGALTIMGPNTVAFNNSGGNTYTGATTISGGTLQAAATNVFSPNSAFTVNANLDLNGFNNTVGSLSGAGRVCSSGGTATLTVGQDNTNTTFSGVLQNGTGVLALTKIGTGTLTLTNTNTYSGGTNLNGGTLAISSDANWGTGPLSFNGGTLEALAAGGGIVSNKAITLNSAGGTFLADAGTASTLSGPIAGTGSWTKTGQGTLILSGANTYSGGTTISAGTLQLGNGGTTGSITGNVLNNGVLAFDRSGTVAFGGVISGTGSVTQIGTGTTILTGSNTYTGGTTISAGTLQAGSATALSQKSEFTVNSILDLHGFSNTIGSLTGTGIPGESPGASMALISNPAIRYRSLPLRTV